MIFFAPFLFPSLTNLSFKETIQLLIQSSYAICLLIVLKKPVLFLNTNSFIQFSESLPVIAFEFPAIARRFGRFLCQRTCYFF